MFGEYRNIVLVVIGLFLLNRILTSIEGYAPIDYSYGVDGRMMSSQDIIDMKNSSMPEMVAPEHMEHTESEFLGRNYNPVHLNNTVSEGKYISYEQPDSFSGVTYN